MSRCHIIPPYLLEKIAADHPDPSVCERSRHTLEVDTLLRSQRRSGPVRRTAAGDAAFSVHTAHNGTELPGDLVREAGQPESGDPAVDEVYVGVEASLALFAEVFGRSSYDGLGASVVSTVHYEKDYDNAFWDGRQLVFGDGDGKVFGRFTRPIDILGHEFTHAVTQFTADLVYEGQSGALNESVSDVFASCLKQRLLGQSAADADWLIGAGIFMPSVRGKALRSMAAPGTAYDDPAIGKDPQVGSMADFVRTREDDGGVHINSGIPNRAFHLAAMSIGGNIWEGAGPIWYAALTSGIGSETDFVGFAEATVTAAQAVSPSVEESVRSAWQEVGVLSSEGSAPAIPTGSVVVTRSGGLAGLSLTGEMTLGDDPRTPEVESILDGLDLKSFGAHRPQPDRYVYRFDIGDEQVVVGEQDLTPELRHLCRLILGS